jgi:3-hydroxybutyryl-CoA dehydrogenase
MAPPALLRRMVAAGHLGRKTGRGFYEYDEKGQRK